MTAVPLPSALRSDAAGTFPWPHRQVRLVPAGAVPRGAVVLGHLVAVPDGADVLAGGRPLAAVPAAPREASVPVAPREATLPETAREIPQQADGVVVDDWGHQVIVDGAPIELTRREFELLRCLAAHPGRVFTRAQLLAEVWELPDARHAPPRTVDVHVSRVRRKLGPHAGALQSLRGVGYRWSAS